MKKFYMTMVAMLCGVAAMAQNELYVEDLKGNAGDVVDLKICLRNDQPVTAISFKMELPEGVSAQGKTKWSLVEDRLDMDLVKYAQASAEEANPDDVDVDPTSVYTFFLQKGVYALAPVPVKFGVDANGEYASEEPADYRFVTFTGNEGPVMIVPLKIASTVVDGVYNIKLFECGVTDTSNPSKNIATSDEATCTLTVGNGTGINSINAADSKAPVYNLAGQRVSKAQKGVFIQSGKKVAVK